MVLMPSCAASYRACSHTMTTSSLRLCRKKPCSQWTDSCLLSHCLNQIEYTWVQNLLADCSHCVIFLVSPVGEQGQNPHLAWYRPWWCDTSFVTLGKAFDQREYQVFGLAGGVRVRLLLILPSWLTASSSSAKQNSTAPMPPRGPGFFTPALFVVS